MFAFVDTWQFHLLGFLITNVIFSQFYKAAVEHTKHDGAATILLQLIAGASIILLIPFMPFTFPTSPFVWGLLGLACVFYAISNRLQTTSRKHLEVSTFSVISQSLTVFLILYGFTVFQEPITGAKVNGALLIIFGNVLLFYQKGRFAVNKYTFMSLLTTITLATAITLDILLMDHFNLPFYIMMTLLIPAIFIAFSERIHPRTIIKEAQYGTFIYYLIAGTAWPLFIFFSLRSFQLGEISLIVPLQATTVLLNVLIATVIHKEFTSLYKKIIAAAIVMFGVYITTLPL
jgi:drug/metabolite transporter (DMT)-like permease